MNWDTAFAVAFVLFWLCKAEQQMNVTLLEWNSRELIYLALADNESGCRRDRPSEVTCSKAQCRALCNSVTKSTFSHYSSSVYLFVLIIFKAIMPFKLKCSQLHAEKGDILTLHRSSYVGCHLPRTDKRVYCMVTDPGSTLKMI